VPTAALAELMATTLAGLGLRRAVVVYGSDGLDEATLSGPTHALWVEDGRSTAESWTPDDYGLPAARVEDLRVAGPADSAARLRGLLAGEAGPARHVVLANAAVALRVVGRATGLRQGVAQAAEAIDSGAAAGLLERWARLSRGAS